VRVTPEAYYLFDAAAGGVPELCDAFKVRCVVHSPSYFDLGLLILGTTDTCTSLPQGGSRASEQEAVHPLAHRVAPLDTPLLDTCLSDILVGHLTRIAQVLAPYLLHPCRMDHPDRQRLHMAHLPHQISGDIKHQRHMRLPLGLLPPSRRLHLRIRSQLA
jgi:hypothetical protein